MVAMVSSTVATAVLLAVLGTDACFSFVAPTSSSVPSSLRHRNPIKAAAAAIASHNITCSSSSSFWDDPLRIASLPDPPSSELLALIREKPYRGGFEPAIDADGPYEPRIVYGSIPSDLVGTLASNGAGRIRVGNTQYGHWFDGDGFVSLLSLDGKANRAVFNGRYIRSGRFKAQQQLMERLRRQESDNAEALADPPLAFSGAWTKRGKGEWYENIGRIPTNPANTATMWLESSSDATSAHTAPKLYALCEGGHPIQLDPKTLDVMKDERPLVSSDGSTAVGSFFSAHFKRCPVTGEIYNHGFLIRPGPLPKEMNVMRLSSRGELLQQEKSSLPFDCLTHDSAMSSNYLVFFLPPYYIAKDKIFSLMSGTATLGNMVEWHEDDKAFVQIVSKDDLKLKWRIELPETTSLYHLVDAHEVESDEHGSICLKVRIAEHEPMDRIALERQFADQYRVTEGERINAILKEYTFHLEGNGNGSFVSKRTVAEDSALCEFPVVNSAYRPKDRRRYCWVNALSDPTGEWLDGLQKVDMKLGSSSRVVDFGPGTFAGPPTFIPREKMGAEDDGYVLVTVYKALEHRSDIVVLDAASLETLCIMELRHHLPFQFHADYMSDS
mmetsp:Transcript_39172/g.85946  ORF Transcript_39172/g.85946 Transcript_39172/m.85946 type:complete len:612 (-) Transcript_39172:29-1864(-)